MLSSSRLRLHSRARAPARVRHRRRYRELNAFTYICASFARLSFAPHVLTIAGVRQSASALPFVSFRSSDRKTKSSTALTRDSTPWLADSAESKQNERMAARKQKNKIITMEALHQKGENNNNDSRAVTFFPRRIDRQVMILNPSLAK